MTLSAAVDNGATVTAGTVTFCDTSFTHCEDAAVLGKAQLTSLGTAVIRLIPGIGSHSYQAFFAGTTSNLASSSTAQSVTVTGQHPTIANISSSGAVGDYMLTATVVGKGSASFTPSGSVAFADSTNSSTLGSATLGSSTLAQTFTAQVTHSAGVNPSAIAVGDLNGDGIPDLAVTDATSNVVNILLGNADGTFQSAVSYSVGTSPCSIAVGDLNGDGKLDLAVANCGAGGSVLWGNGDGTFPTQATFDSGGAPQFVAIGDFNGDGALDLVVANQSGTSISVLMNNNDGTFGPPLTSTLGFNPSAIAVGDFNHDGVPDLAVTNHDSGSVTILIGNGDGTFASPSGTYSVGTTPSYIAVADFNWDGNPDLVVANGDGTVSILFGNANGTFNPQATYPVGISPLSLVVGDFNGDGNTDIAVANSADNTVSVLLNKGNGTFPPQVTVAVGRLPHSVASADFDGDGFADLVVANYGDGNSAGNVSLLLNKVTQTATAEVSGVSVTGSGPHSVNFTYAGDSNFAGSIASATSLTAQQVATTLALSANPVSSSGYGQAVVLTASLSPSSAGSQSVSGESITFNNGASALGWGVLNPAGVAILTLPSLAVGAYNLTAVYSGDTNFVSSSSSAQSFTVVKATPAITWPNPASVTSGTALSSAQLNATASTPGAFHYSPAAGTIPAVGSDTLAVSFTPDDATNYTTATANVILTVLAPPILSVAFVPAQIALNGVTTLTFEIANPSGNTAALVGVGFTDALPAGLAVASPDGLTNNCNGTASDLSSSTITLSGGTITPNGTCTLRVNVTALVSSGYTDSPGAVTSTNGGTGNSTYANLMVGSAVATSASSVDFGSQIVGATSSSQSIQLNNNSADVLTLDGVFATGDFSQTNACTNVAPGGNCTIAISFTPTVTGPRYGALVVLDSAGTQVVMLIGIGDAPGVSLSPSNVNFGSEVVGTSSAGQSITLGNSGDSTLSITAITVSGDFGETGACSTIVAGRNCAIQVTFSPSATGTRNGIVSIVDNAGTQEVSLQGTGTEPGVGLSESTLTFGSQTLGTTSGAQTVTLTNTGASSLIVTSFSTGGDFAVSSADCILPKTIAGGGSCTLQIAFAPAATGGRTGVVTIADSVGTQVIALTGTGTAPGVTLSPATLSFGSVAVGGGSQLTVGILLDLATASSLQVTGVTTTGDFTVNNQCANPVAPGSSCSLSVTFTPVAMGLRTGTVLIAYTVGSNSGQLALALNGTGTAPVVSLSSSTLNFGSQVVATTSASQSVTVTNTGTGTLDIATVSASGDFVASGNCVSSGPLGPGGTCTVGVTFTPAVAGTRSGAVTIADSAGTHVIALGGTGNVPGVSLLSPNLTFGSQVVNTTSGAQMVTLTNSGTSDLTISSVTAAGDFSESDTCVTTLASTTACTISITFTPAVTGTRNGTITIASPLGTYVISLAGTGNAPGVQLSSASLTFGSQTVGTTSGSQTLTLTNAGSSDLAISSLMASGDFSTSDNCVSGSPVPAGNTCTISVTFAPQAVGLRSGSVVITDSAGTHVVALSGTGAAPGVSLSPATLSFGSVTVGTNSQLPATVNLTAGTASNLNVTSVNVSGDYTVVNHCTGAVAPGGSCNVSVTFTPTATGPRTGTAVIAYTVGSGAGQVVLALTGIGASPGISLTPSSINFGSETVGMTTAAQAVALTNTGTSTLTVSSVTAAGDFSETNDCASVAAGAGCTVQVAFTPSAAGIRNGSITIADNAGLQSVPLSGTGQVPGASLSSSSVTFGSQVVGTTSGQQTVTLTNSGVGVVTVSKVTAAGDFAETNNCSTIASSGTCAIQITFTPSATGALTGTITIVDNVGTQVIAVGGTGTGPGTSLSFSNLSYGSQTVGTTSGAQTAVLTNNGTSALNVTSFSASGDFGVSSSNCSTLPATVNTNGNCAFQITFTPSVTGARTGSVIIYDSLGIQVVALTGTGSAPGVALSPSTLNLGSVTVGNTAQQTASVTLDVATSGTLQVSNVSVSGDYTVVNNCTSAVSPGGSCSVSVTFAPAAIGTHTGAVVIAYTEATTTGTLVLALTGTGTAPGVSLSPSSITFGSQVVGSTSSAQAVTLTNNGTSGLTGITVTTVGDFSQTNNCSTASAGASCTINVKFAPTSSGARSGSVLISDNAGTQVLPVSGTATAPGVSLSPSNINFGNQVVGITSTTHSFTVTNNGTATLTVSSVTASGDFAISSNGCGSVGATLNCTVQTTFTPSAIGVRTGTVSITDSAGTHAVALTGTGTAGGVGVSATSVDFGSYTVGTVSTTKTVTLTNTGTSLLSVSSFTAFGDYAVSSPDCASLPTSLAVNAICTLQLVFRPSATGARPGSVSISDSAGTSVVTLTGVGLAPGVTLSPTSLSFGSVTVGGSSQLTVNINVDGATTGSLTVTPGSISGNFTLSNNCVSVPAGAACSFSVTFVPTVAATSTGTVVINYTVGTFAGQLTLPLTGIGAAPGVTLAPPTVAFGSQAVGTTSSTQSITLTNSGTSVLQGISIAASGDFAQINTCPNSAGVGASCTITLSFTPVAIGSRSGTIAITDNIGTQIAVLSGTGSASGVGLSASNLNFGAQLINTISAGQTVTVTNIGNSALTFSNVVAAGDFVDTNTCTGSIAPNATCSVTISFDPSQTGLRNGTVTLLGNAGAQVVVLTGTGTSNVTVTLSPMQLFFGQQTVGNPSTSQQATLSNNSGADLTVNSCSVTGDFLLTNSGCPTPATLPNGNTFPVSVAFQPTASGSRVGVLWVSDTTGTRGVTLNGTGMDPNINLSPSTLNFGNITTGNTSVPQWVTLTNTGSNSLTVSSLTASAEFSVSSSNCNNLPAVLSNGSQCSLELIFTPTEAGNTIGSLTILDSLGTHSVTLFGNGQLPGLVLSQATLSFGSQTVDTSSPAQTATLTNSGLSALSVSSIVASGDYSVSSASCANLPVTLNVGHGCDLVVTFSPAVAGARNGAVTISDSGGTHSVAMTGVGVPPGVSLSLSNLNFGNVIVGATSQLTTTINVDATTEAPLQVASITLSGDYTQTNNCSAPATVSPGNSCYISLTFVPTATGTSTGTALIEYTLGTGTGELVLQLTAVGTAPGVTLNPASLAFGSQVIDTTSTAQSVTLTNSGTSGLTVSSVTAAGDFAQTNNCASVPAGSGCTINVTFIPSSTDIPTPSTLRTGSVSIKDDAGTQVVPLTGVGTAPGVSLAPSTLSFANQTVSTTSVSQAVVLTNNGTSTLNITSVTPAGDFSQSNNCSAVTANATCTINVSFTPRATGSRSGTVTVKDDTGTQVITVSGTGTAAAVGLSVTSIDFGSQTVGTTSGAVAVTVTNTGGSTLTIATYQAVGDYGVTSANCTTVNSGANCTLQITLSPTTTGTRVGSVIVTDTAGVQTIALIGLGTAPGVSLSPSNLNFGSVALGSSSQLVVNIQLDVASAAAMHVNSVTVDGDFSVVNNCSAAVSPGGQCNITVTFTPTRTGATTGSAAINYTVGTASTTLTVALSGTGLSPVVTLNPPNVNFGSQIVGTTSSVQLVTLTNSGNSGLTGPLGSGLSAPTISVTGDYTESNNCSGGISPAGSCTLTVAFAPTSKGTRNGIVTITDNLGVQTLALAGTGTAPGVGLSPSTITFGSQVVGSTSGTQTITVTNSGTSNLTVTSLVASGDFAQTNNCSTITSGNTCAIQVTFAPTTTGIRNGTINIVDNAGTHFATLSGTGTAPGVSLTSATLVFGSQVLNSTSASQSVTLTNNGTSPLTITSVTTGGDFAETDSCISGSPLAANGTCTVTVTFTPAAASGRTGAINIAGAAGNQVISLSGTGTAPGVSLNPASLIFGSQVVSTNSSSQSFTLTNNGSSGLTIGPVSASGDFTQTNNCLARSPLASNGTCAITVAFSPTATGTRSGTVTVTDGAGTHFAALTGSGAAPGVGLSLSTLTFGSQTVGTTSGAQTVTLTNSGTSSLTVTSFATGGDFVVASSDCTALPASLAPAGTCTLQVTFSPSAAGTRTGTAVITDSIGTHVIALTGTATAPGASLSPANLNFGSVTVGGSSQLPVSVNLDASTSSGLQVTGTSISGDYTLTSSCTSGVSPGSSCGLSVTFNPTATGTRTGIALIDYTVGADSAVLVLTLTGTGAAPGVSLSTPTLSFGSQVVSTTSATQSITVTNNGTSSLTVSAVTATGDFAQTNTCATVTAGNACAIQVTFTPTTTGTRNGTVSIVDNTGTQVVALAGTGNAPGVGLAPSTLIFTSQNVSTTSASQTATLTNTGTSNLSVTSFTAAGDFAVSSSNCSTLPKTVAAAGTCSFQVTFTPVASGTRNGTVTVVDSVGTHVVTLTGTGAAPGVSLSATNYTFANQVVGTTSAGHAFTLTNNGTSSLTVTSVTASGDFGATNTCVSGSPIAANGTCTITATFTPKVAGARAGAITIVDGAGTQVSTLSGTGTAPLVSLSPTSLAFGSQVVGTASSSQSITLTNGGTSSLIISAVSTSGDFAQTSNCVTTVSAAGTCTVQVTFTPTATGSRTGAITVTDTLGTQVATLTGTGNAPGVGLSPASLTFTSQNIGVTSGAQTVTLTNTGSSNLTITSFSSDGDFAVTSSNCSTLPKTVAAAGTCAFQITFTPAASGSRSGTVTIADSAGTHVIALSGTGSAPGVNLSASSLTFGSQVVSTTSASQSVTLTNNGTSSLVVSSMSVTGDFAQTNNCATVTSGNTCTIQVTFAPTSAGTRNGSVNLVDNAGTQVITLSGNGTAPGVSLAPSSRAFGSQPVQSASAAQNIVLTNTGSSALTISSITAAGDFAQANNCLTVASGGTCTIQVTFTPATAGARVGSVNIVDTAGTQIATLSGAGTAPGVSLSPTTLSFGSQVVNTSSTSQSTTLSNTGSGNLAISSVTASGDFSESDNCTSGSPLVANATCAVTVTFTPVAAGVRTGTVTITDSLGSHVAALSGTGAAPGVGLSPATINFGNQGVAATSASQLATLTNTGGSVLTVTSLSASGDFSETNNCTNISAGGNCAIHVSFTPVVTGARNGATTINSNDGTWSLALAGNGTAPGGLVSPSSLLFGSQQIGVPSLTQNFTFTNTGTSPLTVSSVTAAGDFSQTNNCSTLAVQGQCSVAITFSPTATGTRNGSVTIVDSLASHVVVLSGVGYTFTGGLSVASLTFGSQTVGTASPMQSATLVNQGDSALTVTSIAVTGDFDVGSSDCATLPASLPPSSVCTLQVTFSPSAVGNRSGTVAIADNNGSHVLVLAGSGAAPGVSLSPPSLSFGSVVVGTTSQLTANVSVDPSTSAQATVTGVTASGDFSVTNPCSGPINPGSQCGSSLTFAPSAPGVRTGTAIITYTLGSSTDQLILALTGNGTAPGVVLSPPNINFGSVIVNTNSATQTVTVTNNGTSDLTVTNLAADGDFTQTNNCSDLAANANCTIQITFTPTSTGVRNGTITLVDNAGTQTVNLTGTGNAPGVALDFSRLAFPGQVVGTTGTAQTVTVSNNGTSDLIVTSVTTAGDFSQTNTCTDVIAGRSCTIQVSFAPTATGTRNGTITMVDGSGTHVVALTGIGNAPGVGLSLSQIIFGSQTVGTSSAEQSATLTNVGSSSLVIGELTASGDFSVSSLDCPSLPATVSVSATCTLEAIFTPTAAGVRSGTITILDSDGTHAIALTGVGAAPGVALSPANLNFGSVVVGTTSQLTANVSVDPSASAQATVTGVTASGDFGVTNPCSGPINPGSQCGLSLTFAPSAAGVRSGTAVITYTMGSGTDQLILALSGNGAVPGVLLSPPSINFGSQIVNTNSALQTVTVTNNGTSDLTVSNLVADGDFAQTNTCTDLIAGGSCAIGVTFTPTATSTRNGTITMVDNAGTQVVALMGTGNAPGVGLSVSQITFGTQTVGTSSATQSATLTNVGSSSLVISDITASGDFSVTSPDCPSLPATVSGAAACTMQATFAPTAPGMRTGTITILDSGGTHAIALTGVGAAPGVSLSPANLNFGSVVVGASSQLTVGLNLDAASTGPLQVTGASISGDFTWVSGCGTAVNPGGQCSFSVTFSPTASGVRTGTAIISYSLGSGSNQLILALSGNGTVPGVYLLPPVLVFGTQIVGSRSTAQTITVSNTGTSLLVVSSVSAIGDFAQINNCSNIAPGASCTVQVTFTPAAIGTRNGTIVLTDNAGIHVVALTGSGNAPGIGLTPATLTFGSQVVGTTSAEQSVVVTNTGTSSLAIGTVSAAGDFAQTDNCTTIIPSGSCTLQVTFTATASGTRNGTITLAGSAGTYVVSLNGTGNASGVGLNSTTLVFASQALNTTSDSQRVILTNNGTSNLAITAIAAGGDFAQSNDCVSNSPLTAGNTCNIDVAFTPTATGARTGAVTIANGAGMQVIALSGTGVAPGVTLAPASLNFGSQLVSTTSAAQNLTLTNSGTSNLTISGVNASGDFAETDNCMNSPGLAPGAACTMTVTFTPSATGSRSGSVAITDGAGTHVAILAGTGDAPGVGLSTPILYFGSQTIGTDSGGETVTLTNTGGSDLSITKLSSAGDFAVSGVNCTILPTTLPAGSNCTLQVTFTPAAVGVRNGTVSIEDSAGTHVVALTGTGTSPGASLSPASVNFGSAVVGASSQLTANVSVDSGTSSALIVTGVTISGDFNVVNPCSTPISPGDQCGLSITFTPVVAGVRTGTAVVNYSVGTITGQLVLALTGDGTAPGVFISPPTVNFGSQLIDTASQPQNVTLTNDGGDMLVVSSVTAAGDFSETDNCATVTPGGNCTFRITFTPTALGTRNGTIALLDNAGVHVLALTGSGNAAGTAVSPAVLTFSSDSLGAASTAQTVTFINTGGVPVGVNSIVVAGAFAATNDCTTIIPGGYCTVQTTFTPAASTANHAKAGISATNATVQANDTSTSAISNGTITIIASNGTQVVALRTANNAPGAQLDPASLDFGDRVLGTTSPGQTVILTNTGTSTLTVSSVTSGGDFAESNNCTTIMQGADCTIQVTFAPTVAGTRSGSVMLTDNAGGHIVILSGTGVEPSVGFSPATMTFPETTVTKTSAAQSVNITNIGGTALTIAGVLSSSEFSETDNCATAALAPGAGCVANVTFTPANSGLRAGTLTIISNSKGSPQVVPLSGIGGDFSLAPNSGTTLTATVSAGGTATYTALLSALNYQGSLSLLCLGAPTNSTCVAQPGSAIMTGNNSTTITVTVKTTAPGAANVTQGGVPRFPGWSWLPGIAAGILIPWHRRAFRRKMRREIVRTLLTLGVVMLLIVLSACGGSPSGSGGGSTPPPGTPKGNYQLMLVGTGGDGLQRGVEMVLQVN